MDAFDKAQQQTIDGAMGLDNAEAFAAARKRAQEFVGEAHDVSWEDLCREVNGKLVRIARRLILTKWIWP